MLRQVHSQKGNPQFLLYLSRVNFLIKLFFVNYSHLRYPFSSRLYLLINIHSVTDVLIMYLHNDSHLPKLHVQTQIATHISSHLFAYHIKCTLNEVWIRWSP